MMLPLQIQSASDTAASQSTIIPPMTTKPCAPSIKEFKEYHTDTTVKFVITMTDEQFAQAHAVGLEKKFKLSSSATFLNDLPGSASAVAALLIRVGLDGIRNQSQQQASKGDHS